MLMNSGYWKSLWVGLTTIALSILIFNDGMNPHELHQFHLNNSPYKDTKHLGKIDRFNQGLSPDRFHEEIYELTMNPRYRNTRLREQTTCATTG